MLLTLGLKVVSLICRCTTARTCGAWGVGSRPRPATHRLLSPRPTRHALPDRPPVHITTHPDRATPLPPTPRFAVQISIEKAAFFMHKALGAQEPDTFLAASASAEAAIDEFMTYHRHVCAWEVVCVGGSVFRTFSHARELGLGARVILRPRELGPGARRARVVKQVRAPARGLACVQAVPVRWRRPERPGADSRSARNHVLFQRCLRACCMRHACAVWRSRGCARGRRHFPRGCPHGCRPPC